MTLFLVLETINQIIKDRGFEPIRLFDILFSDKIASQAEPDKLRLKLLTAEANKRKKVTNDIERFFNVLNYDDAGNPRITTIKNPTYPNNRCLHVHFIKSRESGIYASNKQSVDTKNYHVMSRTEGDQFDYYMKPRDEYVESMSFSQIGKDVVQSLIRKVYETTFIKYNQKYTITDLILITESDLTPAGTGILNAVSNRPGFNLTIFRHDELLTPISEHILYNHHQKLSDQEVNKLFTENDLRRNKIPLLSDKDPVCKYYGWKQGDVIRITRNIDYYPKLAPKSLQYRVVTRIG